MTLSLADRSQKISGIKILSQVGVDPDQDRKTLLKVNNSNDSAYLNYTNITCRKKKKN